MHWAFSLLNIFCSDAVMRKENERLKIIANDDTIKIIGYKEYIFQNAQEVVLG